DLLIRTGGEQRLSDFLLWECAYAELHFTPRQWPDYERSDLAEAITEFHGRQRRFGRVSDSTVTPVRTPSTLRLHK
ncbi:MAG: undecaprenyl diphosphate synthase family protein, partial [Longimicrobiales bacterium]